jgi:hypothetical protein
MLIVAFACFLALLLAWLFVPTSGRDEAHQPSAATTLTAAEATGD